MFGIFFSARARPGKQQELLEFLRWNGARSLELEAGALRFEVYRDPQDDEAFLVYEGYVDRGAFDLHKEGEAYQRWAGGLREELCSELRVILMDEAVFPAL